MLKRWLIGSGLVLSCVLPACDRQQGERPPGKVTGADVRQDAGKAADTAVRFSAQSKQEFEEKLEKRLEEAGVEIEKLREQGAELKDDAKAAWDRKIVRLEAKRDAARGKLDEFKKSSVEAWKDLEKGARAAWEDMDQAFVDAAKEF